MIEVTCNDRLGKKVRVKCNNDDTIGDLKKLIAAQTGTRFDRIVLKKWYTIFKDHITLRDYEIHDGIFGKSSGVQYIDSSNIKMYNQLHTSHGKMLEYCLLFF